MNNFYLSLNDELEQLKNSSQLRSIAPLEFKKGKYVSVNGKKLLNLCSNNYLGVAYDEELKQKFLSSFDLANFGSGSARLLGGNSNEHEKLDVLLSSMFQKEAALLFNSGYHANIGLISALCGSGDVIFSDKLNHASIIDGMKLSGADFYRYKHLDYSHLKQMLEKHRKNHKRAVIITESIFSMDGDIADISSLVELKKEFDAVLIVDEAHAFGIYGENGCGICEKERLLPDIDLVVGTFGKAIGSMGAFAVGNAIIVDYLINKARSFIFSTVIPDVNVQWSRFILNEIKTGYGSKIKNLEDISCRLRADFTENGISTCGNSQIIPAILGENEKTVQIAQRLSSCGYYVLPVRPPTVPKGTSRLRFSLSADMQWDELKNISGIIKEEF